jgi:hypothetical protein
MGYLVWVQDLRRPVSTDNRSRGTRVAGVAGEVRFSSCTTSSDAMKSRPSSTWH